MTALEHYEGNQGEQIILPIPETAPQLDPETKHQLVNEIATQLCKAQVNAMHIRMTGMSIIGSEYDAPVDMDRFDQVTAEIVQIAGEIIVRADLRDGQWLEGGAVHNGRLQGMSYASNGQNGPEIRYIFANIDRHELQEVPPHQLISLGDIAVGDMIARVPTFSRFPPRQDGAIQ
jgi:hypothetical protein